MDASDLVAVVRQYVGFSLVKNTRRTELKITECPVLNKLGKAGIVPVCYAFCCLFENQSEEYFDKKKSI